MKTSGRVTINDVAAAAGVSRQTVSNVVRQQGRLSPATHDRVQSVIERLGYLPHAGAASLRSGRTYRIAHPIPAADLRTDNTVMLEFLRALLDAAGQRGHQVLVSGCDTGLQAVRDLVRSRSVDGFVLTGTAGDDPRVDLLARQRIPFACFGRTGPGRPQHWVDIDNRAAVAAMTSRVLAAGHRRVAFLGYAPIGYWDLEREGGYRDAMAAAGLDPAVTRVAGPAESGAAAADLAAGPGRPTAIVTGSDMLAAACYAAANQAGLRIGPEPGAGLAVTGFDGSAISRLLVPALTTVALPLDRIAARLADRVIRQAAGERDGPGEIVGAVIVAGGSG